MTGAEADYDIHDITHRVRSVDARSPLFSGTTLSCFTNGRCFFLTDDQVGTLAGLVSSGQLRRRPGGGWEEVVPGEGLRFLAERRIDGATYYRFQPHWKFAAGPG
jgi:hypothetical protein